MKQLLTFILLGLVSLVYSQNDCSEALVVCGNSGFNNLLVLGAGIQEVSGANSCGSQEHNSLWLDVTIKNAGVLAFTIKPESNDINEDFDFFVFGPNVDCNNIEQAIRCSTTNPSSAKLSSNHTGMSSSARDTTEGPGPDGDGFVSVINASAGERYFIVIDRPIGTSNFTIDWTGNATFNDAPFADIPFGNLIDLEECDNLLPLNDNITKFDLTQNNIIIGNQQNVSISYHTNNTDANSGSNSITNPESYLNISSPQQIYSRLENQITGCYSVYEFTLSISNGIPLQTAKLEECDQDNDGFTMFNLTALNDEVLNEVSANEYNITYHSSKSDAEKNLGQLPFNFINKIQNRQEIFVRVEDKVNAFCISVIEVELIVKDTPEINETVTLKQCDTDNDAITSFNLEEVRSKISDNYEEEVINFYRTMSDAQNSINVINNPISYTNLVPSIDRVWATVTNKNECTKIAQVDLISSTTSIPSSFLKTIKQCVDLLDDNDTDGIATFDFSAADAEINNIFNASGQKITISYYESIGDALSEKNSIINVSNYRNTNSPNQQNIYVRVDNDLDNSCLGLGHHITLLVDPVPDFTIEAPDVLCVNTSEYLRFNGDQSINYKYEWFLKDNPQQIGTSSELQISEAGVYQLIVTNPNTMCNKIEEVEVKRASSLDITVNDLFIEDDFKETGKYAVTIKEESFNVDLYEYSLFLEGGNQTPFQNSNNFIGLTGGKYLLIIRDKQGCEADVYLDFFLFQYPRFFTPNGDGNNDIWAIEGFDEKLYKNTRLVIFNRYGKIVYETSKLTNGWNGFSRGSLVPSNDYWFSIEMTDLNNKVYLVKGHFSLLRSQ
ncbi:T9SS type B sorting domain-containing protein [Polaribacter vadi]|uniref:T9SS type B sorting domain-containing protein n=1 Tax=Polaribacter vadi TaxID=1774273 RepID=UPI0030EF8944|tara:strand:+ start:3068 stop:5581 length:2514 start_codon:yes stop_codon:yes gene_type:complete